MQWHILHESRGRMRIYLPGAHMTLHKGDLLEYTLSARENVADAHVYDLTCDALFRPPHGGHSGAGRQTL